MRLLSDQRDSVVDTKAQTSVRPKEPWQVASPFRLTVHSIR